MENDREQRTDEQLVAASVAGNTELFSTLVDRYMSTVYQYARRLCGDEEEAQDITQEVFVKAWRNLGKFRPEQASFKTWLLRIARNTIFDALRKRIHATVSFSAFDTEDGGNVLVDGLSEDAPLPDEEAAMADDAEHLEEALRELPIAARDVLILRYRQELTFEEIGTALSEPLNTVKSRHRRALLALREILARRGLSR